MSSGDQVLMGRFRIILDGEGLHPIESHGEEETDAALILQLNTEWFPKQEQLRLKFGTVHSRVAKFSRTNVSLSYSFIYFSIPLHMLRKKRLK